MSSSESLTQCLDQKNVFAVFFFTLFGIAVVFLVVMSITKRRTRFKTHIANGRPGPVLPLDMLDGFKDRYAYSVAFATVTSYIVNMVINGTDIPNISRYLKILVKIYVVVVIATCAYPFFVCIGMRHRLKGSIIGLVYTATWFFMMGSFYVGLFKACALSKESVTFSTFYKIPEFTGLVLLGLLFSKRIYQHCRDRSRFYGEDEKVPKENHMHSYVRNLLKKNDRRLIVTESKSRATQFIKILKDMVYQPVPGFRFSTRIVCTYTVCYVTLYMFAVSDLYFGINLHQFGSLFKGTLGDKLNQIFRIFVGFFLFSTVVVSIKSCLFLLHMLNCQRKDIMRLRLGDRSWLPPSMERYEISPTGLTFGWMKYAGYQVGFFVMGYILQVACLWLVPSVIISLLTFDYCRKKALEFLPIPVIGFASYFAQRLLVKFVFVQKKEGTAILNNRKALNIFSYYMFFYNALLGFIGGLFRAAIALAVGLFCFERIQRSIWPSSLQFLDRGYRSYIGYLQIEHTFSNPVLRVFVDLLRGVDKYRSSEARNDLHDVHWSTSSIHDRRNPRLRNKWLVAYTLLKNPSLVPFRKIGKDLLTEKEAAKPSAKLPQIPEQIKIDFINISV